MIRCALCGRDGARGYETMPAAELEPGRGYVGGQQVQLPPTVAYVWVCAGRASCRRRRGLRP